MTTSQLRRHAPGKHKVVPRTKLFPGEIIKADQLGIDIDTPVHPGRIPHVRASIGGPKTASPQAPTPVKEMPGQALVRAISQLRTEERVASPEVLSPPLSRSVGVEVVPHGVFVARRIASVRREDIKLGLVGPEEDEADGYLPYPGDPTDEDLAQQAGAA